MQIKPIIHHIESFFSLSYYYCLLVKGDEFFFDFFFREWWSMSVHKSANVSWSSATDAAAVITSWSAIDKFANRHLRRRKGRRQGGESFVILCDLADARMGGGVIRVGGDVAGRRDANTGGPDAWDASLRAGEEIDSRFEQLVTTKYMAMYAIPV